MDISWSYKNKSHIFDIEDSMGVPYLSLKALDNIRLVINGFSTRTGGASRGKLSVANFSYSRKDATEDVLENFTRTAAALEVERDWVAVPRQTHTVNLRQITQEDARKGVARERNYRDIDGLTTNMPRLTLVTFYVGCMPLYLLSPVNRAIGLSHSGRRGTIKRMGQVTMGAMKEAFGTKPEDLIACVGPSVCQECFEVGGKVVEEFRKVSEPGYQEELCCQGRRLRKHQLDLRKANEIIFREAGVRQGNIHITSVYTMRNNDYLFSYRKAGEEQGSLATLLCLR